MLSGMWGQERDGSASLKGCVWDSVWGHMCLPGCKSLQQWLSMYVHTCVPLWGVHSGPSLFCVSSCECVWFCTCSLWCVTVLYLCMCVYDCVPVSVCFIYFEKYLCEYMNLWMCYLGMWLNEKYLLCVPKYLLCGWDDIFTDVFVVCLPVACVRPHIHKCCCPSLHVHEYGWLQVSESVHYVYVCLLSIRDYVCTFVCSVFARVWDYLY